MTYYTNVPTPAGELLLTSNGQRITGMHWKVFKRAPLAQADWIEDQNFFTEVINQLQEYFAGSRQIFNLDYELSGTPFQMQVWHELQKIPFGQSSSYQTIATSIGRPKAVRAVGTAVGSNPISIVIPCHRVLTTGGKIGGYAGGLDSKRVLLRAEQILWHDK